jgi:hypothetical protein
VQSPGSSAGCIEASEDSIAGADKFETKADILIEPDGTVVFVSLFEDLLPVAQALDPGIVDSFGRKMP